MHQLVRQFVRSSRDAFKLPRIHVAKRAICVCLSKSLLVENRCERPGSPKIEVRMSSAQAESETLQRSEFIEQETMSSGKWLALNKITYKDPRGKKRTWEAVERVTKIADTADGVVIMALLKRTLKYDCLILVKQYRPPLKAYTLEFPAGLVDKGETVEQTAARELFEETGYTGKIKHTSPATCLDAGTESCTTILATAEIDGDHPQNMEPKQKTEEGEFIEVILVPVNELLKRINEYASAGVVVDSRVYTYAIALMQSHKQHKLVPTETFFRQ